MSWQYKEAVSVARVMDCEVALTRIEVWETRRDSSSIDGSVRTRRLTVSRGVSIHSSFFLMLDVTRTELNLDLIQMSLGLLSTWKWISAESTSACARDHEACLTNAYTLYMLLHVHLGRCKNILQTCQKPC
jgi:hypothetical protein